MKSLFIRLLLVIFSVQGAIAAIGDDAVLQGQGKAAAACSSLPCSGSSSIDSGGAEVFPVIEELSDYVIIGLPASKASYRVGASSSVPVQLLSIDLPKVKPPPRT